jgi:tetratricopeptide (TPR) repeat protein
MARRLRLMTRVGVATMAILFLAVIPYSLAVREAKRANNLAREEAQQRRRAEIEGAKSQQTADFFKQMLKGAAPSVALGRDSSMMRDILNSTAEGITELKDQPEVEAELRTTLGQVYQELGDYTAAEDMFSKALQLYRGMPKISELKIAQCLSDLSMALSAQGKGEQAEKSQLGALEIRRKFPDADLAVAESLQNLGTIFSGEARLSDAEKQFREALAIRQEKLGPVHVLVAESMNGVAHMLTSLGQWKEAETIFRHSLEMSRTLLLGPRHPTYVSALDGLVQSLLTLGKLSEAEEDAREGIKLEKSLLGPEHPRVASSLTRLARILEKGERLPEARTNLEEALTIWRKRLNNQDPSMGETVTALLDILLSSTNFAEANDIFQQVLVPVASAERPNTSVLYVCGNYLARKGQWQQATEKFLKLVRLEPNNHHAYQALAALYAQMGELRSYREVRAKILATFSSTTNDPRIADRMAKSCLILRPEPQDLAKIARLADISVTFDAKSAATAWFQFCKGFAEYRQGHFKEAERWMGKVLEHVTEGSTRDVEAYMVLAMAQHQSGQPEVARDTFAEANRFAQRRLRDVNSGDIESGWTDWILAQALMREAGEMFRNSLPVRSDPPE